MLLAWDDTDSREGGCSTQLLWEVLAAVPELRLRGMPRLVRLNPNIPHKTRGNAAVVLPLGREEGPHTVVGADGDMPLHAWPESRPRGLDSALFGRVVRAIEDHSQPGAAPAIAWSPGPLPAVAYWQAVQSVVTKQAAAAALEGALVAGAERQGIVGCAGALAWPGPPSSFELLAVRERGRWGTPRDMTPDILHDLDGGPTFHSWDLEDDVPTCIPHTPCPVLAGLRGRDPERLVEEALPMLRRASGEPIAAWAVWATNQASGDHVVDVASVAAAPEHATVRVPAIVRTAPEAHAGGRIEVMLDDGACRFPAIAFEPTKRFRHVVAALRPGDEVTATGAFDGALKLEKLQVRRAVDQRVANPVSASGRRMKSVGAGRGFRDRRSGERADEDQGSLASRAELEGTYEVPVMARRHLHRPETTGTNTDRSTLRIVSS